MSDGYRSGDPVSVFDPKRMRWTSARIVCATNPTRATVAARDWWAIVPRAFLRPVYLVGRAA